MKIEEIRDALTTGRPLKCTSLEEAEIVRLFLVKIFKSETITLDENWVIKVPENLKQYVTLLRHAPENSVLNTEKDAENIVKKINNQIAKLKAKENKLKKEKEIDIKITKLMSIIEKEPEKYLNSEEIFFTAIEVAENKYLTLSNVMKWLEINLTAPEMASFKINNKKSEETFIDVLKILKKTTMMNEYSDEMLQQGLERYIEKQNQLYLSKLREKMNSIFTTEEIKEDLFVLWLKNTIYTYLDLSPINTEKNEGNDSIYLFNQTKIEESNISSTTPNIWTLAFSDENTLEKFLQLPIVKKFHLEKQTIESKFGEQKKETYVINLNDHQLMQIIGMLDKSRLRREKKDIESKIENSQKYLSLLALIQKQNTPFPELNSIIELTEKFSQREESQKKNKEEQQKENLEFFETNIRDYQEYFEDLSPHGLLTLLAACKQMNISEVNLLHLINEINENENEETLARILGKKHFFDALIYLPETEETWSDYFKMFPKKIFDAELVISGFEKINKDQWDIYYACSKDFEIVKNLKLAPEDFIGLRSRFSPEKLIDLMIFFDQKGLLKKSFSNTVADLIINSNRKSGEREAQITRLTESGYAKNVDWEINDIDTIMCSTVEIINGITHVTGGNTEKVREKFIQSINIQKIDFSEMKSDLPTLIQNIPELCLIEPIQSGKINFKDIKTIDNVIDLLRLPAAATYANYQFQLLEIISKKLDLKKIIKTPEDLSSILCQMDTLLPSDTIESIYARKCIFLFIENGIFKHLEWTKEDNDKLMSRYFLDRKEFSRLIEDNWHLQGTKEDNDKMMNHYFLEKKSRRWFYIESLSKQIDVTKIMLPTEIASNAIDEIENIFLNAGIEEEKSNEIFSHSVPLVFKEIYKIVKNAEDSEKTLNDIAGRLTKLTEDEKKSMPKLVEELQSLLKNYSNITEKSFTLEKEIKYN